MSGGHVTRALGALVSAPVLAGLHAAAWLLSRFGVARLLRGVSIPRLREHRLRTSLTTLGIALGVAALVGVMLVAGAVEQGVTQSISDLAGRADLQVSAKAGGLEEALLSRLARVPGVHRVTPVVQQIVTLRAANGERERLLVLGVDMLGRDDGYFRSYDSRELDEIRRDPLPFLNSSTNIILSRSVSDQLGARVRDTVAIATDSGVQQFEIWGLVGRQGVGNAFGGAIALMYYPAMQVAFGRGRTLDGIDVAVRPGHDAAEVARAVQAELGSGFHVQRPKLRGERVTKLFGAMRMGLVMTGLIALAAGGFLVFSTLTISVVQRRRELGVLRALGTTRRQLVVLLALEGGLFGIVGSVIGIGLGALLSNAMLRLTSATVSEIYVEQVPGHVALDARAAAFGFAVGTAAAMLAALLATRRALVVQPREALSQAPPTAGLAAPAALRAGDRLGVLALLGAALLSALPAHDGLPIGPLAASFALLLAGRALMPRLVQLLHRGLAPLREALFGVEAHLASHNLPRDMGRTANTAAALMVAAALSVSSATFFASFIASLDEWAAQTLPGDLFVTSGTSLAGMSSRNTPVSEALGPLLAAVPGVQRVRSIRIVDADYAGVPIKLSATEISAFVQRSRFAAAQGTPDQIARDLQAGDVAVSENFAHTFGVNRGDALELPVLGGTRQFRVAGVIVDYTSDRGSVVLDRSTYVAGWKDRRVDTYELHLAPGADAEQVRRHIDANLSAQHDLFVLTHHDFQREFRGAIERATSLTRVLEIVTLLIALLGMATALSANVLDRVREIGVLRAIGMLRAQVRKLIVLESALLSAFGLVAGCALGLVLGYMSLRRVVTVETGWYLPFRPPLAAIVQLLATSLPISALAGFFPARRAAALAVVDALDYE